AERPRRTPNARAERRTPAPNARAERPRRTPCAPRGRPNARAVGPSATALPRAVVRPVGAPPRGREPRPRASSTARAHAHAVAERCHCEAPHGYGSVTPLDNGARAGLCACAAAVTDATLATWGSRLTSARASCAAGAHDQGEDPRRTIPRPGASQQARFCTSPRVDRFPRWRPGARARARLPRLRQGATHSRHALRTNDRMGWGLP